MAAVMPVMCKCPRVQSCQGGRPALSRAGRSGSHCLRPRRPLSLPLAATLPPAPGGRVSSAAALRARPPCPPAPPPLSPAAPPRCLPLGRPPSLGPRLPQKDLSQRHSGCGEHAASSLQGKALPCCTPAAKALCGRMATRPGSTASASRPFGGAVTAVPARRWGA